MKTAMPLRLLGICLGFIASAASVMAQTTTPAGGKASVPADADIRKILIERIDTMKQGVGIVVGVVDPRGRRVIAYGKLESNDPRKLDGDTIFEIGSTTKVFTSLLLADMTQRGEVSLSDPVSKYLPPQVKMPERGGKSITLADLSRHMSGLPRMPDNLVPADPANPYADYSVQQMYDFLSHYQLPRDIGSQFEYSNLGGGLLGHVLALRAAMNYEDLVQSRVCKPLGMDSTGITLSPEQKARLALGHGPTLQHASNWDLPTLAGAGALRSTANDMLKFLAANLGEPKTPLSQAMALMVKDRRPTGEPARQIGLGWLIDAADGRDIIWHNGGTGGYRSFIGYCPQTKVGIAVLSNTFTDPGVDDIGMHLLDPRRQLLAPPKPHTEVAIDQKLLDGYVGRFALAPTAIFTITHEGDVLFAQLTGQPKFQVFPEGPRDFFYKVVDAQLTFEVDANGRATGLILHQNAHNLPAKRVE